MGDSEKRFTEEQLEKIGELRASIQFAQLQKEGLRKFAEIQNKGMKEESWVGAIALAAVAAMGAAQLYYNAGTPPLGFAFGALGTGALVFWTYRRRMMSRARELELMQVELELDKAISQAHEAIREAKGNG